MRTSFRIVVLAMLAVTVPALSGCTNFDPDNLDVFKLNEKKKLPGERKDLFPEGVPGVTQGIPPEYMKGSQPPPETAQALQAPASENKTMEEAEPQKKAAATESESQPKPKPKRTAKPRTAPQQAASQPQQPMAPWPQQNPQPAPQQAQSPWPTQGQTTTAPWPSSPQPGTFSR
jgi:hypothetical protein